MTHEKETPQAQPAAETGHAHAGKRKRRGSADLRTLSEVLFVALVCVGLAFHTGTGTASSFGIGTIATLCPLGALETAIASRTIVPPALIGLAIVVVLTLALGRAFCSWVCPVPLLRRIFGGKKRAEAAGEQKGRKARRARGAGKRARAAAETDAAKKPAKPHPLQIPKPKRGSVHDSRNWVLGGALVATAAFGFPVFCLICPVRLTFATVILIWRLFQFSELTWSFLVFPLILVAELVVLKRWCHSFCPLGALLSLISRGNRTLRPHSAPESCLVTAHGTDCHRCASACPEGIDLHRHEESTPLNECTKCRRCADACPVQAITFPVLPKRQKKEGE